MNAAPLALVVMLAAPATITGPATATAPAVRLAPKLGVEATIRAIWPDDLEDRAVAIARRESALVPTARNACCYGLFQIYWELHRSWLAELGITDPAQLLDARTNTVAAVALYALAGWSPWAL